MFTTEQTGAGTGDGVLGRGWNWSCSTVDPWHAHEVKNDDHEILLLRTCMYTEGEMGKVANCNSGSHLKIQSN